MSSVVLKRLVLAAFITLPVATSTRAAFVLETGFATYGMFAPPHDFNGINGLSVDAGSAFFAHGSNVWRLTLDSFALSTAGDLPPGHYGISVVQRFGGATHAAYAVTNSFTSPYRFGGFDQGGGFQPLFELGGLYDTAVNSSGTLYLIAMPEFFQTKVFRYDAASSSVTEVIHVSGFSGGIAFDSQDRLYVAEQTIGQVLRFTPDQLAAGGLYAANGEVIMKTRVSYMCFDPNDRLYAVTGYGNEMAVYDPDTGLMQRTVAVDDAGGYGIGWIRWNREHQSLVTIYSDYSDWPTVASELRVVVFAGPADGISGTSGVFRGWIAAVEHLDRPNPDSGGFARGDDFQSASPARAVIGRPAEFDNDVGNSHVYSLGKGGSITLALDDAIVNGPGPDFAVFENGFYFHDEIYAEFAFVEVGTTTNAWARFPVTTFATNPVGPFEMTRVAHIDGVAGKTALEFGTPFDLDWLRHHPTVTNGLVDLNRIAYIRLVDIIGDGSVTDSFGNPIYDPHDAGDVSTDGFDLRGIGVIHLAGITMEFIGGTPSALWHGYQGRTYQPQVMNGGSWQNIGGPITGTGGVHRVVLSGGHDHIMFRVEHTIPAEP